MKKFRQDVPYPTWQARCAHIQN
jgi:hypothetical protein